MLKVELNMDNHQSCLQIGKYIDNVLSISQFSLQLEPPFTLPPKINGINGTITSSSISSIITRITQ